MKSKKIYAMFLSTAIAATTCVYASDPKSSSLPCSAAPGSMLGAPGDQSEHTQSRLEGSEETPANTIEGFDHDATPNSPESPSASLSAAPTGPDSYQVVTVLPNNNMRMRKTSDGAVNTFVKIVMYIRAHRDESDDKLRQWVDSKLQNGRLSCCYVSSKSRYSSNYYYHYCTRHDVVRNIVDFLKHQRDISSDYHRQCADNITAFFIASAANLPQPEPVDSESGSQPQNCPSVLRIIPKEEIMSKTEHLTECGVMLGLRTAFIFPSASLSAAPTTLPPRSANAVILLIRD